MNGGGADETPVVRLRGLGKVFVTEEVETLQHTNEWDKPPAGRDKPVPYWPPRM